MPPQTTFAMIIHIHYTGKFVLLSSKNILLEAKLTTVMTDFNDEKTQLAAKALEWQEKYENLAAEVEAE